MRFYLSCALVLVLALTGRADEIAKARAAAALALAKLQRERNVSTDAAKAAAVLMLHKVQRERETAAAAARPRTYAEAYELAIREKKPLAAFIDLPAREIAGVVSVRVKWEEGFQAYPRQHVAVSAGSPALYLMRVLPATASDEDIRNAQPKEVQVSVPDPFGVQGPRLSVKALPEARGAVRLPVGR